MKKLSVVLKVITPMLSFGNDMENSEFRITELKALMRSTFRELYYFKNIENMKEKEDKLFGSVNIKSPISFKLNKIDKKSFGEVNMLPHKQMSKVSCIKESSKIYIDIIIKNNEYIPIYSMLLIQASIIGALGKRSRKGFGSFIIESMLLNGEDEYKDLLIGKPEEILKNCNKFILDKDLGEYILGINKDEVNNEIVINNLSSNLDYPYVKKISFMKICDKEYMGLIKKISQLTHDRLRKKDKKKDNEEDFIDGIENNQEIKRTILGNCKEEKSKLKRVASPVSISFWENSDEKYMVIKELNYNYILQKLNIRTDKSRKANDEYIQKYIKELNDIGGNDKSELFISYNNWTCSELYRRV